MLFKSITEERIWVEDNCTLRCYRDPQDCPILTKARSTGRKPVEWERKPRAKTIATQIKCAEQRKTAPRAPKTKLFEDVPLFDETPYRIDVGYVPVPGWPQRPGRADTDHA